MKIWLGPNNICVNFGGGGSAIIKNKTLIRTQYYLLVHNKTKRRAGQQR